MKQHNTLPKNCSVLTVHLHKILFSSIKVFLMLFLFGAATFTTHAQVAKDYQHWSDVASAWQGNILNDVKSDYFEGDVIPHVFVAGTPSNQLSTGSSYSFDIVYNYYWQTSNSGGFAYLTTYNVSRAATGIQGNAPTQSGPALPNGGGHFFTVNATITAVSSPSTIGSGNLDQKVTVTFTYTGANGGTAEVYFGLYVATPGTVPPQGLGTTIGAHAWSGGSLQTTIGQGAGALSLQLSPDAILVGTISGLKYSDVNNTGWRDIGEPGLQGWTIQLDNDNDPSNVNTLPSTTTDANGNYSFSPVAGTYYVREVQQTGWSQTQPASNGQYGPITISPATPTSTGNIFGNYFCITPTPTATASPTTINLLAATQTSQLDVSGLAGNATDYTYSWVQDPTTGGSLSNASIKNPVFTATAADDYDFTVTVTSIYSSTCSAQSPVTVSAAGSFPNCTTDPKSMCSGVSTTFTVNGPTNPDATNIFYAWTIIPSSAGSINGSNTGSSVSVTSSSTSNFTVRLTMSAANTSITPVTCDYAVTVNGLPTPTLSGPASPCINSTGNVYTTESGMTNYTWTVTGGTITAGGTSTDNTVTVTWGAPGTGHVTVNYTDANGCRASAATDKTVTISSCGAAIYTYTQGKLGNTESSTVCVPGGSFKGGGTALIQLSLDNMDGTLNNSAGQLYLGASGHSFTANYADASVLNGIMPGGGPANQLASDYDLSSSTPTIPLPPTKKGKINNILFSQTITLAVNINIPGNGLAGFELHPGWLTTYPSGNSCSGGSCFSSPLTTNATLISWMNTAPTKTVADLLAKASSALGGTSLSGYSYSDINNMVDVINRAFDGGRITGNGINAYLSSSPCLRIGEPLITSTETTNPALLLNPKAEITSAFKLAAKAYPNPYYDRISFSIESDITGRGVLEVFNLKGQKIQTVLDGNVIAGKSQMIQFNVPAQHRTSLMYRFTVGKKSVTGKLIRAN